jgi:upstream activation factor subunit UAF30
MLPSINLDVTSMKQFRAKLLAACPMQKNTNKSTLNFWIKVELQCHYEKQQQTTLMKPDNLVDRATENPAETTRKKVPVESSPQEPPQDRRVCVERVSQEEKDRLLAQSLQSMERVHQTRRSKAAAASDTKVSNKRPTTNTSTFTSASQEEGAAADLSKPKKRKGGFPTCYTSPALKLILDGAETCTSSTSVKKIWAYIKEHNLQDPKDRRYILADEKLLPLFGKSRVKMTEVPGKISRNLYPISQ